MAVLMTACPLMDVSNPPNTDIFMLQTAAEIIHETTNKRSNYRRQQKRLTKTLRRVLAEATTEHPFNELAAQQFSNNSSFNDEVRRMFGTRTPITHRQWSYIVARAHHNTIQHLNSSGHVPVSAIAEDPYASFVRHILALYVNTYGIAKATTELNEWSADLHAHSEGGCLAATWCRQMLDPEETARGGTESIVSASIRKHYCPAEVTGHIKMYVKNKLHELKKAKADKTKQSDLTTAIFYEETVNPTARIHGEVVPNDLMPLIREDVSDLLYTAMETMSENALRLLTAYLDPANAELGTSKRLFSSGLVAVRSQAGVGERKARQLHAEILTRLREVFKVSVRTEEIEALMITDKTVRSRMANGKYVKGYKAQPTSLVKITVDKAHSEELSGKDIAQIFDYIHKGGRIIGEDS